MARILLWALACLQLSECYTPLRSPLAGKRAATRAATPSMMPIGVPKVRCTAALWRRAR